MKRIIFALGLLACFAAPLLGETSEEKAVAFFRPTVSGEATKVYFLVYVIDVDEIDSVNQSFVANVFVGLRWKDLRLTGQADPVTKMPLEDIWHPGILIANKQTLMRASLPEVATVRPDGTVEYRQRFVGPLSQPLKLKEFPFDQHDFTIHFISPGYSPKEVEFLPREISTPEAKIIGGGMAKELSLPDWEVRKSGALVLPYVPVPGLEVSGFAFRFTAQRHRLYYLLQIIAPLLLIVTMSWLAFWIDPAESGTQVAMAMSSVLTLIAYRLVLANLIPRLPYMTRMDHLIAGCMFLVFLALIEVIITTVFSHKGKRQKALRIDRYSRRVFPAALIAVAIWSLIL